MPSLFKPLVAHGQRSYMLSFSIALPVEMADFEGTDEELIEFAIQESLQDSCKLPFSSTADWYAEHSSLHSKCN